MAADPDVKKAAKEFIDGALAARARDSAIRRRSRRSRMDEPSTRQPTSLSACRDDRPEVARPRRGSGEM